MTTIAQANRAIADAGYPLELVRGVGYHYFIYDIPEANIYETVSVYVCYTNTYTPKGWVNEARNAWEDIRKTMDSR